MAKVSVVVPSRNERFLAPTVADLLAKSRGDCEIIVILEGYWEHNLPSDKRVKQIHFGKPHGMRAAINAGVAASTGDYIMKSDAHCMFSEGWDLQLQKDYLENDWILIPRRYPLDPEQWAWEQRTDHKYPIDYHYLCDPFEKHGDAVIGVHGTFWRERRDQRKHIQIDEEMASQGSCWFMSRKYWDYIGPLNDKLYGLFWYESQEMSLKAWMSGGAQMITKNAWYAHWRKGSKGGRGYSTRGMGHEDATAYVSWFWLTDQPFKGRTRNFRWLLERFWPVPTWNPDLDAVFRRAHEQFRNPYQVAA